MLGDLHFYGKEGIQFFTKPKTITANWNPDVVSRHDIAATHACVALSTFLVLGCGASSRGISGPACC